MWNKMCLNFRFRVKQWIFIKWLHIVVVANKLSVLFLCFTYLVLLPGTAIFLPKQTFLGHFVCHRKYWRPINRMMLLFWQLLHWEEEESHSRHCYSKQTLFTAPRLLQRWNNTIIVFIQVCYCKSGTQHYSLLLCCAGKVDSALRTIWRMAFWTD